MWAIRRLMETRNFKTLNVWGDIVSFHDRWLLSWDIYLQISNICASALPVHMMEISDRAESVKARLASYYYFEDSASVTAYELGAWQNRGGARRFWDKCLIIKLREYSKRFCYAWYGELRCASDAMNCKSLSQLSAFGLKTVLQF